MRRISRARHREEVRTVLPPHLIDLHELQVGLVHECGGLESVALALPAHVAARQPAELVVDERREGVERSLIPGAPGQQQLGHLRRRRHPGRAVLRVRNAEW